MILCIHEKGVVAPQKSSAAVPSERRKPGTCESIATGLNETFSCGVTTGKSPFFITPENKDSVVKVSILFS